MPALYVSDYGEGVTHAINSYTLQPDQDISSGGWMLLGTNDQSTFARIDTRKGTAFPAGVAKQFNVGNSDSFRWYYLYLQDGFPVGSNVEFHLHDITPAPAPTAPDTMDIGIVIERAPLVVIVDFNGRATRVDHYNLTSSETLPANQSWQLRGTNDPNILGSDDPSSSTLLDDRSGIGFTGGQPEQFTVPSPGGYLYYVFYFQSGFSVRGMNLEIHLSETPATPIPTPTPTGTPSPTPSPPVTPAPTPTPPPIVNFEGSPRAGYAPLTVNFTDTSTGTFSTWSWDFGDGTTSSEQHPVHTYLTPGLFNVNLTVCNGGDCAWLNRSYYIYVPQQSTATPTTTPRYYIKISGGGSGYTSGSTSGSGSTGAPPQGSESGQSGTSESGPAGSTGGQEIRSQPAQQGGDGSGTGSGVGRGTGHGSGSSGGQGNSQPGMGREQARGGIIAVLLDALSQVRTLTGDLLQYLQSQIRFLFGG